jgi:hypothetical protein
MINPDGSMQNKHLWIDGTFDKRRIIFPDDLDKSVWELADKLSETSQQVEPSYESRAVYI